MTEANGELLDAQGSDSKCEKPDETLHDIEFFHVLLELQPNTEDDEEHPANSTYMLPVVLQAGVKKGYDRETFISHLFRFEEAGYVTLFPDDEEADLDQLKDGKLFDKIQICINEAKILPVLLKASLTLNEYIKKLADQFEKQKPVWEQYISGREEMDRQHKAVAEWYKKSGEIKTSLEELIGNDKKNRALEAENLRQDMEDITKKRVDDQIEDELKRSGRIGAAMQDMQKDIIQFMGIFIAIFALLGLNISNANNWSAADFFHVNLVITASMATLLFLISVIMTGKSRRTHCMGILSAALWALSAFVFFVFPYLEDEIISFWRTYYK